MILAACAYWYSTLRISSVLFRGRIGGLTESRCVRLVLVIVPFVLDDVCQRPSGHRRRPLWWTPSLSTSRACGNTDETCTRLLMNCVSPRPPTVVQRERTLYAANSASDSTALPPSSASSSLSSPPPRRRWRCRLKTPRHSPLSSRRSSPRSSRRSQQPQSTLRRPLSHFLRRNRRRHPFLSAQSLEVFLQASF